VVQRQRKDAAVKWATRVVRDHSVIAVEDFKPKFLARSTMARKAADNGIGMTKTELVERGMRAGREVVLVPPAYTTMTCSDCGTRAKDRLLLSQRTFRCTSCGVVPPDRNTTHIAVGHAHR
jgi:putative transposase